VLVTPDVANRQTLNRVLAVLHTVAEAGRRTSISQVAADRGLPAPTVHRIVAQLVKRGMLCRAFESKRAVVAPLLIKPGTVAPESALRADRPHQLLVTLANRLGEHCQIGRRGAMESSPAEIAAVISSED
jgi:DNA-binding IclR family transcriptional regulator